MAVFSRRRDRSPSAFGGWPPGGHHLRHSGFLSAAVVLWNAADSRTGGQPLVGRRPSAGRPSLPDRTLTKPRTALRSPFGREGRQRLTASTPARLRQHSGAADRRDRATRAAVGRWRLAAARLIVESHAPPGASKCSNWPMPARWSLQKRPRGRHRSTGGQPLVLTPCLPARPLDI